MIPKIKNQKDVILKVTATAICGSGLHIYSGGIPQPAAPGIMAAKDAWLRGAGRVINVDTVKYRLDKAKATATSETILWEDDSKNIVEDIRSITNNRGADVCVDADGFEPDRNLIKEAGS